MTVDSFDPQAMNSAVTAAQVAQWLLLADRCELDGDSPSIEAAEPDLMASILLPGWDLAAVDLSDAELESLVRLFTLGEMQHGSWKAGAKSPVVPLVKSCTATVDGSSCQATSTSSPLSTSLRKSAES